MNRNYLVINQERKQKKVEKEESNSEHDKEIDEHTFNIFDRRRRPLLLRI